MDNDTLIALRSAIDNAGLDAINARIALFKGITIKTPGVQQVSQILHDLYVETRSARLTRSAAKTAGLPLPRTDSQIVGIVGDSHTGKSRAVEHYMAEVLPRSNVGKGSRPVLHVELSSDATLRTLWSDVLTEFGDPNPTGSRIVLENRVATLAQRHETEVVIIDECQHLLSKSRSSTKLADMLKRCVQRANFALVLVGQQKDIESILRDEQLANRVTRLLRFERGSADHFKDTERFRKFLAHLDNKMVKTGIFSQSSQLAASGTWEGIFNACDGLVGVASKLVLAAIRNTVPEAERLERADLEAAIALRAMVRPTPSAR